jgi:hypothetical protein
MVIMAAMVEGWGGMALLDKLLSIDAIVGQYVHGGLWCSPRLRPRAGRSAAMSRFLAVKAEPVSSAGPQPSRKDTDALSTLEAVVS